MPFRQEVHFCALALNGESIVAKGSNGTTFRNEVLAALPLVELEPLRLLLTRVRWTNGQALYEPGERIEHVYFVEEGLASVVAEADDANSRVEAGMAGRESMAGLSALLDPETTSFNRVFVQMAGVAYRMTAPALLESVVTMPTLRRLLFRALDASMAQVAQTAVCNSRHSLPERLARWLLFAHDRVDGDELPLTQAFLSIMLGVRRSGVTIADLPPEEWTPGYADFASACSGVMYPMAEWIR